MVLLSFRYDTLYHIRHMKSKGQIITEEALSFHPKTILDIGYAQIPNPDLLRDGAMVYGVDIVSVPTSYTKTFVCDLNTMSLPFKDGEIEMVTMGCTLAHVANPLKVLGEINRVLAHNGTLILSSPNPNYYWENVLNVFYHHFKNKVSKAKHIEHFFEFSRYNMRTIGERAGFKVTKEVGTTFYLVKTSLRFNPIAMPGLAYEIVYVLKKVGAPRSYATFESEKGIEEVPTDLYT